MFIASRVTIRTIILLVRSRVIIGVMGVQFD